VCTKTIPVSYILPNRHLTHRWTFSLIAVINDFIPSLISESSTPERKERMLDLFNLFLPIYLISYSFTVYFHFRVNFPCLSSMFVPTSAFMSMSHDMNMDNWAWNIFEREISPPTHVSPYNTYLFSLTPHRSPSKQHSLPPLINRILILILVPHI
jgi:hypothetical protein